MIYQHLRPRVVCVCGRMLGCCKGCNRLRLVQAWRKRSCGRLRSLFKKKMLLLVLCASSMPVKRTLVWSWLASHKSVRTTGAKGEDIHVFMFSIQKHLRCQLVGCLHHYAANSG